MSHQREREHKREPPAISTSERELWLELKREPGVLKAGGFALTLMIPFSRHFHAIKLTPFNSASISLNGHMQWRHGSITKRRRR